MDSTEQPTEPAPDRVANLDTDPVPELFVTCSRGVEKLLGDELTQLGAEAVRPRNGGVECTATPETTYRILLWSRLASRVLRPLSRFAVADADALYAGAHALDWPALFEVHKRFVIEVAGRSAAVTHTHYAGLKVKDAIADRFRAATGERPSVDTESPQVCVHLHLRNDAATLSLDLAGDSLHRRGYRGRAGEAPLKENLACAILTLAGWPALAAEGAPLYDPMCGSGTLLIEAAWMAADIAPGILRREFSAEHLLDHRPALLRRLRAEAEERRRAGLAGLRSVIAGSDGDAQAVGTARSNLGRAGLDGRIAVSCADALDVRPPTASPGLLVSNPPYGERLGSEAEMIKLYSLLGPRLKQHFGGWRGALFTARPDLGHRLGLRADAMHTLYNGAIECRLLGFNLRAAAAAPTLSQQTGERSATALPPSAADAAGASRSPWEQGNGGGTATVGGLDFANRLRKNLKHLSKWARRSGVSNYRVYDADLPDYALAIDLYATPDLHAHVQEYAAPKTIDPARAEKRLREALVQLQDVLALPADRLHYKLRKSQKGSEQYQRQADSGHFHTVEEHGCRLRVNFDDYLDTGVFLDHRPMRLRIQREARGKRFLNLFCYTGAATVHAAVGGAAQTVSVDLSNTYLDWAKQNLALNDIRGWDYEHPPAPGAALTHHALIRADCLSWLRTQAADPRAQRFDLIFLDPPTFSNSKKMDDTLDIQRDHAAMIEDCLSLLSPDGVLYFSTNRRGFKLDPALQSLATITAITGQTLDEDFRRGTPAHQCWKISRN